MLRFTALSCLQCEIRLGTKEVTATDDETNGWQRVVTTSDDERDYLYVTKRRSTSEQDSCATLNENGKAACKD